MNRRHWIRQSLLTGGALSLLPALAQGRYGPSATSRSAELDYIGCGDADAWDQGPSAAPPVRLSANENPYGPSPAARAALAEASGLGSRYAYGAAMRLSAALAQREGVTPEQVLVGAGSKDLLALIALAFASGSSSAGADFVAPSPTYNFLLLAAEGLGARWVQVPLDAQQRVDLDAVARAITPSTRLVYLCNPHNPTGTYLPGADLLAFIRRTAARVPVVVDEAYLEFIPDAGYPSAVQLVQQGLDVLVVRTFSKVHGMAGLRVGHVVSTPARIQQLARFATVSAMNLAVTSIAAAQASLADTAFLADVVRRNAEVRARTVQALEALGIRPVPAVANFIAWPLPPAKAAFKAEMLQRGYQVSDFAIKGADGTQPWARLSIGTAADMDGFLAAFVPWWRGA